MGLLIETVKEIGNKAKRVTIKELIMNYLEASRRNRPEVPLTAGLLFDEIFMLYPSLKDEQDIVNELFAMKREGIISWDPDSEVGLSNKAIIKMQPK